MSTSAVADLLDPFRRRGATVYGGESVSVLEHSLQAAELARADGAHETLVAACLLHDVGWLLAGPGKGHEQRGAEFLADRLPERVVEPVRLHVAAKRYLCAVDPGYDDQLSPASRRTLLSQGGHFTPEEAAEFSRAPFGPDAVILRRYDDQAKVLGATTAPLEAYQDLLARLAQPAMPA
jgi:[1-hydroxy-2-(trimethylamino)ethyl]phosphonate dioxygenase